MSPRTKINAKPVAKTIEFASLSVPQLQKQLRECWVRTEQAIKEEMAPLLYHLREKLKRQGSRNGEGFAAWVEDNLGLSLSTVNRWANDYAIAEGLKEPRNETAPTATSSHLTRSEVEPSEGQFPVQLLLTAAQQESFRQAMEILGDAASQLIFEFVIAAAEQKMDTRAGEARQ